MVKIPAVENKYEGEKIFILGNGPSLTEIPLEKLDSEYTLAMNNINEIYDKTSWRPSFYYLPQSPTHIQTPDSFEQNNYVTENINLDIPCFIASGYSDILGKIENVMYIDKMELWGINPFHKCDKQGVRNMEIDHLKKYWSTDVNHFIFQYHAMYGALQIATYMGFSSIYLLGCDLGFEYKNPHMIFEKGLDPYRFEGDKIGFLKQSYKEGNFIQSIINGFAMETIVRFPEERILNGFFNMNTKDHFVSDYYKGVQIEDGPKHEREIVKSHIAAKRILEDSGISIYNATSGGDLEVYERLDIERLI